MTELQRAAMDYVRRGFAIFPLQVRGKAPLTPNGVKDASSDPTIVQQWWDKWPDANIGLAAGEINNLLVVDLDIDEDKGLDGYHTLRDWELENGSFPETWTSITGRGGYHLFFRTKEKYKNRVGILDGIDIRSSGGYVVVPPSIHPNGQTYQWETGPDDMEISELSDTVKYFLRSSAPQENGKEHHDEARHMVLPEKVPAGKRNDIMFRLACSLQSKGLTDEAIFAACIKENQKRCDPPLEEAELRTIINSCITRFRKGTAIYFDSKGEAHEGQHEPDIERDAKGRVVQSIKNAAEAVEFDPALYGKIRYNELAYAPFVIGSLPWELDETAYREWTNFDDSNLRGYIQGKYSITPNYVDDALNIVTHKHSYNPLIDCLEANYKKWDHKTGYIRRLLPKYLGAEDSDYTYEAMKIFMLGAVSRAYKPGCKFDYMLVLVGDQGCGKSTFLRYLAMGNTWYSDNFNCIEGDKASEKLRGMWIVELAELLATKRVKDVEAIKAFLTSTVDTYRPPWGKRTEQRPRMCVFAASTNNAQFLTDRTGNRRFLPIEVKHSDGGNILDRVEELTHDVSMAWGETMQLYVDAKKDPSLRLSEEVEPIAEEMQMNHLEEDPRIGIIQSWLQQHENEKVCAIQICVEALGMDRKDIDRHETSPVITIMRESIQGWESIGRYYTKDYGQQRCYKRNSDFIELDNYGSNSDLPF